MKNILRLFLVGFMCTGCFKSNTILETDLSSYLEEDLGLEISDSSLILFLPHDSCPTCIYTIKEYLDKIDVRDPDLTVVYIGKSQKQLETIFEGFNPRINSVWDADGDGYRQGRIKPQTPTIFKFNKEKVAIEEFSVENTWKLQSEIEVFLSRER